MIPIKDLKKRVVKVQHELRQKKIKILFLAKEEDILYLSGARTGRIMITPEESVIWVKEPYNKLYSRLYEDKKYPLEVREYKKDSIKNYLYGKKLRKITVDSISLDYAQYIKKTLNKKIVYNDVMQEVRSIKSKYEIEQIIKSCKIAKKGMKKAEECVYEGMRELEAVGEIESV